MFFDTGSKINPIVGPDQQVNQKRTSRNKKQKIVWSVSDKFKENKLLVSRILIVICLVGIAALVGWGSFYFLTSIQDEVEEEEFNSVVAKLTSQAHTRVTSTITLLEVLRDAMINKCPTSTSWPNCGMNMAYFATLTCR